MGAKERLAQLVKWSGMGYTEIARRLDPPEDSSWVRNRCTGYSTIKADDLPRLAEAMNIDPCEFFQSGNPFASPKSTMGMSRQQTERGNRMVADLISDWPAMTPEEQEAVCRIAATIHMLRGRVTAEEHGEHENVNHDH